MSDDWKIRFGTAGTSDSFAAQLVGVERLQFSDMTWLA